MSSDLRELADSCFDEAVDTRRAIHTHPELSYQEHGTTTLVRDRLRRLGLEELPCATDTGAVFAVQGGRPGRTVLLRADIDALPLTEEVDVPFRSRVDGVMHACGHDAHTAILLGVARMLASRAEGLPGRYVLVFQPAEEALDGAGRMIAGGLLDVARPDWVLGLHVASLLATGLVAARTGVMMSIAQRVAVRLRGGGGHGALVGREGNALIAAAVLAARLDEVVWGLELEEVPCACSAGVIRAGAAPNVVPRYATLEGTLRTFDDGQHATATERLRALCEEVAETYGVNVELDLPAATPAVINHATATALWRDAARTALGQDRVIEMPPATPSDDVSVLLRRVPGCYFFVGAAPGPRTPPMHHAPDFAIDEECIRVGMTTLAAGALDMAGATAPD